MGRTQWLLLLVAVVLATFVLYRTLRSDAVL
ncbi:MAG: hypothetical protein H6Q77_663, partial [Gemmatimonadetes bacterium]|nr:hypothetical protein [Gemmatimonadota bacterium]